MTLRKLRGTIAGTRSGSATPGQPPYHSEISEEYLDALQRQVDAAKTHGFTLTPIGEPGW